MTSISEKSLQRLVFSKPRLIWSNLSASDIFLCSVLFIFRLNIKKYCLKKWNGWLTSKGKTPGGFLWRTIEAHGLFWNTAALALQDTNWKGGGGDRKLIRIWQEKKKILAEIQTHSIHINLAKYFFLQLCSDPPFHHHHYCHHHYCCYCRELKRKKVPEVIVIRT